MEAKLDPKEPGRHLGCWGLWEPEPGDQHPLPAFSFFICSQHHYPQAIPTRRAVLGYEGVNTKTDAEPSMVTEERLRLSSVFFIPQNPSEPALGSQ